MTALLNIVLGLRPDVEYAAVLCSPSVESYKIWRIEDRPLELDVAAYIEPFVRRNRRRPRLSIEG